MAEFISFITESVWFDNRLDCKNNVSMKETKLYSSSMRKARIKSITPFLTCLGFHDIMMCCKQFFYLTSDLFSLFMKAAHSLSFTIALISNMYPVCGWNNGNYLRNFLSYRSYHFSFSLKVQCHAWCFKCIKFF